MSAKNIRPGLLLTAFLLAACQPGAGDAHTDDVAAIPVETATASRGDIYAVYSGTAPIEAFADATVIAKVGGEVREILVEEGDEVESGDVLARLDGERFRLEMEQAGANLRKLQRDYQRNLDLRDRGLISEGDFEKIQFETEALKAEYELAALEFDYTRIRAPIDGVISERLIKIGNMIEVNEPTFHLTSLEPLISYLHIPEREYRRIDAGQKATVEADAIPGEQFAATVARVSPIVDPDTGTFKITVEVSDPTRRLKPGMFGRINIVYDMRSNAMQIPRSAIVEEDGQPAVYVVNGDIVERRVIRTGYTEGSRIEVIEGLEENEEFVIVGQATLKNGSTVSVINAESTAETAGSADTSSM